MSTDSLFSLLNSSSTLYITIGNTLRSDDGVGPVIASRLSEVPGILIKDAGDRPERAMEWVLELLPSLVVFIDAADFGGAAGEIRELSLESLSESTFSTHRIPLPPIAEWIKCETGAECCFIGIQPLSMALGEGLSPEVERAAAEIVRELGGGIVPYHTSVINPPN
ncbi:MAG: hydrogenase maturation protease [Deltaproteobacteria bacterium]